MMSTLPDFISCIGYLYLIHFAVNFFLKAVYPWLKTSKNLKEYAAGWAVVTGATDGIGKALSTELAKGGMNVFLISRTQSKLDSVSKEIHLLYPKVQIKTLVVDCSKLSDSSVRQTVRTALNALDGGVSILINNVGLSYSYPQYFSELSDTETERILQLNIDSATWMTKIVLPTMEAQKVGGIVNTSSASAHLSCPLLSQYGASKSYLEQLTLCLAAECASKNVSIQCFAPSFVTTKMSKIRHPSFFTPTADTYASWAVANIGSGTVLSSPYPPHALQLCLIDYVPTVVASKIMMVMHQSLRARALKKMAAKKD